MATCFQSFGRVASGFTQYQPRRNIALCLEAGKDAGECLYGAARDYGNNYAGGPQAARLCNRAPARYRGYCFSWFTDCADRGRIELVGPHGAVVCC